MKQSGSRRTQGVSPLIHLTSVKSVPPPPQRLLDNIHQRESSCHQASRFPSAPHPHFLYLHPSLREVLSSQLHLPENQATGGNSCPEMSSGPGLKAPGSNFSASNPPHSQAGFLCGKGYSTDINTKIRQTLEVCDEDFKAASSQILKQAITNTLETNGS